MTRFGSVRREPPDPGSVAVILSALGYQSHHDIFRQRFFELDSEAVTRNPPNDAGYFEVLTLEEKAATHRWRGGRAQHGATLRHIEQHTAGLAVHRVKGGGQHDAIPAVPAEFLIACFSGEGHPVAHPRISSVPSPSSSAIIANESLKWLVAERIIPSAHGAPSEAGSAGA